MDLIHPLDDFLLQQRLSNLKLFRSISVTPPLSCLATSNFSFLAEAHLHHPSNSLPTSDSFSFLTPPTDLPVVLDTGASMSLTPVLSDFIGPLEPAPLKEIRGLTSTTRVVGKGIVEWHICDYWNVSGIIRTMAYYVPDASIRLFSPQSYFQDKANQGSCVIKGQKTTLVLPDHTVLEFPYNPRSNLPLMLTKESIPMGLTRTDIAQLASTTASLLSVTDQTNQNLRPSQKELLLLHFKLGHAGFKWCQQLCRVPQDPLREQIITPKFPALTTCTLPLCTACQLSKQTCRQPEKPVLHSNPVPSLRQNDLQPGDNIPWISICLRYPDVYRILKVKSPLPINTTVVPYLLIMLPASSFSEIKLLLPLAKH
jgi:hypothetical protein